MTKLSQILFFLCLIVIEYLSVASISISIVENSWGKISYIMSFFVLYVFLYFGFTIFTRIGKVSLLLIFSIQIEVVQYLIFDRYFSLLDLVSAGIGIVIAICILAFYDKYIKIKDNSYIRL